MRDIEIVNNWTGKTVNAGVGTFGILTLSSNSGKFVFGRANALALADLVYDANGRARHHKANPPSDAQAEVDPYGVPDEWDPHQAFCEDVDRELKAIGDMLKAKNKAYGDSLLSPVKTFFKGTPVESIQARIDDKISRMAKGSNAGEDPAEDMLGYLVILRIAKARAAA